MMGSAVGADKVLFNESFLPADSRALDLKRYEKGNPVPTGTYRADVSINGVLSNRQDVRVVSESDGTNPIVCFDRKLIQLVGIDIERVQPQQMQALDEGHCLPLADVVEGAHASFDVNSQTIDINVPQVALRRDARGYVSPELWDQGVSAGVLSYNVNTSQTHNEVGGTYRSAYMGLNGGVNVGAWRLRHNGSMRWQTGSSRRYDAVNSYAQRDITSLRSQLTLGDANTTGEIFDTIGYRGVSLATDDRMLPQSLRGYAPVVRGIARTNARVVVRQNGNLLLETNVSPGEFAISDLYATGYGGDIDVTIFEADGEERSFLVPFASVAQLLRPGTSRFSLTAGKTRDQYIDAQANLFQGTYQRGFNNWLTAYTGGQASDDYRAILLGAAVGTPFGAFALDVTSADTQLRNGDLHGQSARLSYSKNLISTGSNFTLAAYRFSSSGYLGLDRALQLSAAEQAGRDTTLFLRPRSRLSLSASQSLGRFGQLYVSGFSQDYWDVEGSDVQYQLSYSRQFSRVSFGLSANRSRFGQGKLQDSVLMTLTVPLNFGDAMGRPQLTTRVNRNDEGRYAEQVTLSGTAGSDRQISYGLSANHDNQTSENNTTIGANGQYTGSSAVVGGSLSHGSTYDSISANLSGSIVALGTGITLSPYAGDTIAVVSAPGAAGAKVGSYPGLRLDDSGMAVVPYLRPYEMNEISIDPSGSDEGVEFDETSKQVAPRAGSVQLVTFGVRAGEAFRARVTLPDGSPLPFGADVTDSQGRSVGMVGQGGQVYARIAVGEQTLFAQVVGPQRCSIALPASTSAPATGTSSPAAVCTPIEAQHSEQP
ncbi:fimbria/pilus outer membrane usher protein [Stenotrophomonas sp. HMWF003]|uniref:fimbria/pilus outer membrane usher protein n=1 Tax=Stenotrophomonas sp. HMWF003 TaxID=2056840 RepID=UPI001C624918|nr:fimbria/pilus outer membrane usher protein [Stenotrophomonas sp. HMWF003]